MKRYDPKTIEPHWQQVWADTNLYAAKDNDPRDKFYALMEFPYPSGDGLHVGHVLGYTAMDIIARHKRMQGFNVLYPIGFDEFGLPTENYAIKHKIAPQVATDRNVATFRKQLRALGLSFDWDREVRTADPDYYRWTQWIFLQLLGQGLAYQAEMPINWCPFEKTGLANEEVVDGKHERCGTPVEKKLLKQWMLKITAYADRLSHDLKTVDYLERISSQQINWIGKSTGASISFALENSKDTIEVFTTAHDTIYGATFLVLAPEHPLVADLTTPAQKGKVNSYIKDAQAKSEIERQETDRAKTGVFTGAYAFHPLTGRLIPIWIADYVLAGYGTGAIMAVPGQDARDYDFATKYELPIVYTTDRGEFVNYQTDIKPARQHYQLANSAEFDGMDYEEGYQKILAKLVASGAGHERTQYKLRDWIFSRQHYWGEPIPVVHCSTDGVVPIPAAQLPVMLPKVESYEPTETGESPLAAMTDWVNTTCPRCGGPAKRETDTMPNWAGSSWYYLRYTDAHNDRAFASEANLNYWTPVDHYNGGMEHTTLHLLYSRFWHKFLFDQGLVPTPEPYAKRTSHGMILGPDGQKMSKSKGNVINPDHVVDQYGADTIRLYEMFMGPFDEQKAWSEDHLAGVSRFLYRVWTWAQEMLEPTAITAESVGYENSLGAFEAEIDRSTHKTLKKVHEDIQEMHFNTAVSALMSHINLLTEARSKQRLLQDNAAALKTRTLRHLILMLAPFTPHIAEELWYSLGEEGSVHAAAWPKYDPALLKDDIVTIVVQVGGKVRGQLALSPDATDDEITDAAKADPKVAAHLAGKTIVKTIVVPRKLISFVVKPT